MQVSDSYEDRDRLIERIKMSPEAQCMIRSGIFDSLLSDSEQTTAEGKETPPAESDSGQKRGRQSRPLIAYPLRIIQTYRLAFRAIFCLDRSVLADDQATSLSAIAEDAQHGPAAFTTTHWSVVLAAQGESPVAHAALEKLCRTYWRPIYMFVRRQGYSHEEAEDLTQGFFEVLLERRDFDKLCAEKGRLRSYLLASLKHFLSDEKERAMALKRGQGRPPIPLENLRADAEKEVELSDSLTAERIYERRWALTLLDHVFTQLRVEYRRADKSALFDWLKQLLPDEPEGPSHAEIAEKMGMTENAINQAFHRFRQRYQFLLREEIAHTVTAPKDVEDELRHLISVLRT